MTAVDVAAGHTDDADVRFDSLAVVLEEAEAVGIGSQRFGLDSKGERCTNNVLD